ncbi:DNA mismatch repair protein Mlh3 [Anthophora retusa]
MEASIISTSNVTNIVECILELVSNSLNANATAIAIRIHGGERKIQVIDNGVGIHIKRLKIIAEYNAESIRNCWNLQDICNRRKQTLTNIRKLSDAMLITSRYYNSSKTYLKVFKTCQDRSIIKIERRPSQGTTVSIYGFHELSLKKWDIAFMYHLIANIAIVNPQVSFSIRDDYRKEVIMTITKPHDPIDIFRLVYNKKVLFHKIWYMKCTKRSDIKFCAYIGLTDVNSTAMQKIFLNNKLVCCPLVLQIVSATFINILKLFGKNQCEQFVKKETIFILLFIWCTEYIFTIEHGKRTLILPNVQGLLQNIKSKILDIFTKNNMPLSISDSKCSKIQNNLIYNYTRDLNDPLYTFNHITNRKITELKGPHIRENIIIKKNNTEEKLNNSNAHFGTNITQLFTPISQINKETIMLTLSEWSNWSYKNTSKIKQFDNSLTFYKHFDFLPRKLHKLLCGNTKLTKTDILNECIGSAFSRKLKSGLQIPDILPHQEIDVRPCKTVRQFREFKLNKELLKFIRILGQMNNEMIAGLITKDNIKMLLIMDQHAIHERIRYEYLLHKYKSQMRNQLFSVKLKDPITIQLSVDNCNLLLSNQVILKQFGITLCVINNDTAIVYAIPECLKKNKYHCDEIKLKINVKNFLTELLQSFATYGSYQSNNLPLTIHNAIATEACHGAIKFGDPLTLKECKWLLKLLTQTKIPTQCAHGRPSIVPLLELTHLNKRHKQIIQVSNVYFVKRKYLSPTNSFA